MLLSFKCNTQLVWKEVIEWVCLASFGVTYIGAHSLGASFHSSSREVLFSLYLWIPVPVVAVLSQYGQTNSVSPSLIIVPCNLGDWELVHYSVLYGFSIWMGREESRKKVVHLYVGFYSNSGSFLVMAWLELILGIMFFLEECEVSYIRWNYIYLMISFLTENFVTLVDKTCI